MSNLQDIKKKENRLSLTSLREKAISRIETSSTESKKSLILPHSDSNSSLSEKELKRDKSFSIVKSSETTNNTSNVVSNQSAVSPISPVDGQKFVKPQEVVNVAPETGEIVLLEKNCNEDDVYDDNEADESSQLSKSGNLLSYPSRPKAASNRKGPSKNPARELSKVSSETSNKQVIIEENTTPVTKTVGVKLPGFANTELKSMKKSDSDTSKNFTAPVNEVDSIRGKLRAVQGAAKEEIRQQESTVRTSTNQLSEIATKSFGNLKNSSVNGKSMEALQVEENLQSARVNLKSVQSVAKGISKENLQQDSTSSSSSATVPEFLLFRSKLKSVNKQQQQGSRDDLEFKNSNSDLSQSRGELRNQSNRFSMLNPTTTSQSDVKPKDNFNRFSQATPVPKTSWSTPSSTQTSPSKNKTTNATANSSANATQLKTLKTDPFINAHGGAIRPTIPLLWVIKGKRKLFVQRVKISFSSLNQTDCFILDLPSLKSNDPEKPTNRPIFVCSGSQSSKVRRVKAIEIANLIKDFDYSGKADICLIELGNIKTRAISDEELKFWQQILQMEQMPSKSSISEKVDSIAKAGQDDVQFDAQMDTEVKLIKFDQNEQKSLYVGAKELKRSLLTTLDAAVLECQNEIYTWAGRLSTDKPRNAALSYAEQLHKSRPDSFLFMEGDKFERVTFKLKFEDWPGGKELSVYNVLEVKQAGNIKPKDKEWKVYDRGSDVKKTDAIDIVRMYDKNSAFENAIAKNSETVDMDPNELIKRDWGFVNLRIWEVHQMSGSSDKNAKVNITPESLEKMEVKYSTDNPFILFSQNCYIFLYEYKEKPPKMTDPVLVERMKITKEELEASMKIHTVMYLWSGAESSVSDQGVTAHMALEIEKNIKTSLGQQPKAKQVRIAEGKEPTHFLTMLRGGRVHKEEPKKIQNLISIFPNPPSPVVVYHRGARGNELDKVLLFHIVGVNEDSVRITQMSSTTSEFICSGAVYVLVEGKKATIWQGSGAFPWEKEAANVFASKILKSANVQKIDEGKEPSEFWNALGGLGERSNEKFWATRPSLSVEWANTNVSLGSTTQAEVKAIPYDIRLWKINHFTNGNPTASEISPFTQGDLEQDSVFILDAYFKVFVWIGAFTARNHDLKEGEVEESSVLKKFAFEKQTAKSAASEFKDVKLALETALKYVDYIDEREQGRINRKSCLVLQSGFETPLFKSQFPNWKSIQRANEEKWPSNICIDDALALFQTKKYSPDVLRNLASTRINLPFGVDLEHLEKYLNPEDFVNIFGMEEQKFFAQPHWKQVEMKRKFGLF